MQIRKTRCVTLIPRFHFHLRSAGKKENKRKKRANLGLAGFPQVDAHFLNPSELFYNWFWKEYCAYFSVLITMRSLVRVSIANQPSLVCDFNTHVIQRWYVQKEMMPCCVQEERLKKWKWFPHYMTFYFILLNKSKQAKTGTGDRFTFSSSRCYFFFFYTSASSLIQVNFFIN